MQWITSRDARAQACGRHASTVAGAFDADKRTVTLEQDNETLRKRVRVLTEIITNLSDYIEQLQRREA